MVYQVRESDELIEQGIGFEEAELSDKEMLILRGWCDRHGYRLLPFSAFVTDVFRRYAFGLGALVVCFNQEFDLSRLFDRPPGAARGQFAGGFSFAYTADPREERLRMKHLNRNASLVAFALPMVKRTSRSGLKRGRAVSPRRGHFVDVKTLSHALTGQGGPLRQVADRLKTTTRKLTVEGHGLVTDDYLMYASHDVQATWECYVALRGRYEALGLTRTPITRILSQASIAKATLREMGIEPGAAARRLKATTKGRLMATYYGGRAEVNIRRQRVEVLHCDVTSAYPSTAVLMGTWRYMTATGIRQRKVTRHVRKVLAGLTVATVLTPTFWREELHTIVRVVPHDDLLPFRTTYQLAEGLEAAAAPTIGLNHVTSTDPQWWTMADCVASTLRTGRAPQVIEGIRFSPHGVQDGLRGIDLFGDPDFAVDPVADDAFRLLVELRAKAKREASAAQKAGEADRADDLSNRAGVLKVVVNSGAYGIGAEVLVTHRETPCQVLCHGDGSGSYGTTTRAIETPGEFFNPVFATFATAGARLFLALAEQLAADAGIDWAYCDTDSMAFVRPEGWSRPRFTAAVNSIRARLQSLYPFKDGGTLLKLEATNHSLDDPTELVPLYCYAVAPKRYALFNLDQGEIVIRDASAHGLGHRIAPYGRDGQPCHPTIPAPAMDLAAAGISRWHHDLWYRIVESDLAGHPDQVDLSDFPNILQPAATQYHVSGYARLGWFADYHRDRAYADQIKAHNFILMFHPREEPGVPAVRPIAPFDTDVARAATRAFDRLTGEPVPLRRLKTYRTALAGYHLQSEWKFRRAESIDTGRVQRRHIVIDGVQFIGKEADRWEERQHLGDELDDRITYPRAEPAPDVELLREGIRRCGVRAVAEESGVSPAMVSMVSTGKRFAASPTRHRLWRAVQALTGT